MFIDFTANFENPICKCEKIDYRWTIVDNNDSFLVKCQNCNISLHVPRPEVKIRNMVKNKKTSFTKPKSKPKHDPVFKVLDYFDKKEENKEDIKDEI